MNDEGRTGFTLLELSIVLVIIGLLAGGILVGRDLIHSAELHATINQYTKYQEAVNAFRLKYNAIPGDLTDQEAAEFGFSPGRPGYPADSGVVHGDGIIEGTGLYSEGLLFWRDLSSAGFIESSLVVATDGNADMTLNPSQYFPAQGGKQYCVENIPAHSTIRRNMRPELLFYRWSLIVGRFVGFQRTLNAGRRVWHRREN